MLTIPRAGSVRCVIIDQIKTTNFIGHRARTLDLPRQGIVLITGENGAGKSTFSDAVSYALWGKTLRGTSPWQDNVSGNVEVVTPNLTVSRGLPKGGKVALSWAHRGITGKANEDTRSKAQNALDAHISEYQVWRYGSVLSAGDTTQFTGAADSDRKALIELMLNIETTEPAVKALRDDLKAAEKTLAAAETKIAVLSANITGCDKRIADAAALFTAIPATGISLAAQVARDAAIADMISRGVALTGIIESAQSEVAQADTELQAARTALAVLRRDIGANTAMSELEGAACITCGRPLGADYHAHVTASIQPALSALRTREAETIGAGKALAERATKAKSSLADLVAERDRLRLEVQAAKAAAQVAAEAERRAVEASRIREDAQAAREKYVAEREGLKAQVVTLTEQIRVSKLAESVLSTQGLRSYLLGSALDSLTLMANIWMSRIARPDFRLTIKPYSDTGFRNAISIDVAGAGGGQGYKAASKGEQKRIDLAILLALGEMSRRAHGDDMGTLWFDECFDGLDDEGRAAVVNMLIELSGARCCVVVSHHPDLIAMLRDHAIRYHMERQTSPAPRTATTSK